MLLFIITEQVSGEGEAQFQYISCYCLSHTEAVKETLNRNFNTSHVTVYLKKKLNQKMIKSYFNTSHVTVYRMATFRVNASQIFQYISCYCLSMYGFLPEHKQKYFNTSHVTV